MNVVARISKDELNELKVKQQAVVISKAQYILCQRGFSASVGEVIRRYRRSEGERLYINLETGEITIKSVEPIVHTSIVAQEILDEANEVNGRAKPEV